jgi:hypothetical protein
LSLRSEEEDIFIVEQEVKTTRSREAVRQCYASSREETLGGAFSDKLFAIQKASHSMRVPECPEICSGFLNLALNIFEF